MNAFFTQAAEHRILSINDLDLLEKLPDAIRKHTALVYGYQPGKNGCFLRPIFRNMHCRNSFVPEIHISISRREEDTVLRISGRPVRIVRAIIAFYFSFLSLMEVIALIAAFTSNLDSLIFVFQPAVMMVLGYLLCKLTTKATFASVVSAIQREFP